MVCALAGATLLYTGCTKDYSEDINNLESRLSTLEGTTIVKLQDAINSLNSSVYDLQNSLAAAKGEITKLQSAEEALTSRVADLESAKAALEKTVGDHTSQIAAIDTDIANLKKDITALQTKDTELQAAIDEINGKITTINGKIADLESKKADKTWVEENYATIKMVQDADADLQSQITKLGTTVSDIKSDLAQAQKDIVALQTAVSTNTTNIATNTSDIAALKTALNTAKDNISALQSDMSQVKIDLKKAQDTADSALEKANNALSEIDTIKEALKSIYTKQEVDKIVADLKEELDGKITKLTDRVKLNEDNIAALQSDMKKAQDAIAANAGDIAVLKAQVSADSAAIVALQAAMKKAQDDITTLQATKVDVDKYVKDSAAFKKNIDAVDTLLAQTIRAYQAADAALDQKIDDLAEATQKALDAKVDTTTFNEFAATVTEWYNSLSESIDVLFARIQSLTYVPEYADGKDRVPFAVLMPSGVIGNTPSVIYPGGDYYQIEYPEDSNIAIEKLDTLKYRIYGEDPAEIIDALLAVYGEDADETADASEEEEDLADMLAFDVVRVAPNTRANLDGAELEIVSMYRDELDDEYDVVSIVVAPHNLSDNFYLGGSVSWSVSLVYTDDARSNQIASCYVNLVPQDKPEFIGTAIIQNRFEENEKDITYTYADTLKIEYTDLKPHGVPTVPTELIFTVGGEDCTWYEAVEKGYQIPEPAYTTTESPCFCDAIDKEAVQKIMDTTKYFVYTSAQDGVDFTKAPVYENNDSTYIVIGGGENVIAEAVYARDTIYVEYEIPGALTVYARQIVKVVPVQIEINSTLYQTDKKEKDLITWTYFDVTETQDMSDAESDAVLFNDPAADPGTCRDSAYVDLNADDVAALAEIGYGLKDFAGKEPVSYALYNKTDEEYAAAYNFVDEKGEAVEDCSDVTIYPYIADGKLYAEFDAFEWDKEYELTAVYKVPTDEKPAVDVTLKCEIVTVDRLRDTIYVTLPADTERDYEVNMRFTDEDVWADGEYEDTLASHGINDKAIIDAFDNQNTNQSDSLTMTLDGKVATKKATQTIIDWETDSEDVLQFTTLFKANNGITKLKVFEPYADYTCVNTLWYGQVVVFQKHMEFNVNGVFDYERINEYVEYMDSLNCYTTVQPLWQPVGATPETNASLNLNIPLTGYEARQVNLAQHFRIRDNHKDEDGEVLGTVCTVDDPEKYEGKELGDLKDEYSYLVRQYYLEDPNGNVLDADDIVVDPRNEETTVIAGADGIVINRDEDTQTDTLRYYSMTDSIDVYATLFVKNANGSMVQMITRFDREATSAPVETYENYVVKKYEPLKALTKKDVSDKFAGAGTADDPYQVIVNNSLKTETSIYEFLSLLDKRGYETIDPTNVDGEYPGWVIGNGKNKDNEEEPGNGYDKGLCVADPDLYGLQFSHSMEMITEVSPETQSRIKFNEKNGVLSYDNTLQTKLAQPIVIKLSILIDYIWGQRGYEGDGDIYVEFTWKEVGE